MSKHYIEMDSQRYAEITFRMNRVVWELRRQGYQDLARRAETHWKRGEIFSPDIRIQLSLRLACFINQCNRESYALSVSNDAADLVLSAGSFS